MIINILISLNDPKMIDTILKWLFLLEMSRNIDGWPSRQLVISAEYIPKESKPL